MNKKSLRSIFYASVLILALCCVQPAFAHGTEPRLEISVERINPGGLVEVRGVDFDYDEPVVLSLMRSEIQIPLIDVTADAEGVFTQIIVLPADLPAGEYKFRAKSDHHLVMSATFLVWGMAEQNQEDNSIRDQSDVQLGPVPTFSADVSSTPLPQATAMVSPVPKRTSTAVTYSILLGAVILALLGVGMLKRR